MMLIDGYALYAAQVLIIALPCPNITCVTLFQRRTTAAAKHIRADTSAQIDGRQTEQSRHEVVSHTPYMPCSIEPGFLDFCWQMPETAAFVNKADMSAVLLVNASMQCCQQVPAKGSRSAGNMG